MTNPSSPLHQHLEERLNQYSYLIPEHMHGAVQRYILQRIPPGSFLQAVLENNLKEAAARADHLNKEALARWVEFCVCALPSGSWGSKEKVAQWLNPEPETTPEIDELTNGEDFETDFLP